MKSQPVTLAVYHICKRALVFIRCEEHLMQTHEVLGDAMLQY